MTRRTVVAEARPYPFERDLEHAGRMARIPGRQGQFKVLAHETNPRTGSSWWALIGPQTAGDPGQFTHVREIALVPVKRARKGA
jgi:hypothetical protein